jgi:hypothetical protein
MAQVFSPPVKININVTPPAVPQVTAQSPVTTSTPTWNWDAVTGAVRYKVLLNDVETTSVTAPSYTPNTPLTPGTHTLQVIAVDMVGNVSTPSTAVSVEIIAVGPPAPANLQVDKDPATTETQVWTWNAASDAVAYEIQVRMGNTAWSTPVLLADTLTYTTYAVGSGITLFLRVRGIDNTGTRGLWSDYGSVVLDNVPLQAPETISINNATVVENIHWTNDTTPKIMWGAVSGATQYTVEIDGQVIGTTEVPGYELTSPLAEGEHTIRIGVDNTPLEPDNSACWKGFLKYVSDKYDVFGINLIKNIVNTQLNAVLGELRSLESAEKDFINRLATNAVQLSGLNELLQSVNMLYSSIPWAAFAGCPDVMAIKQGMEQQKQSISDEISAIRNQVTQLNQMFDGQKQLQNELSGAKSAFNKFLGGLFK